MPAKIRECVYKGKKGFSSDKGGTCYTGPDAREKAASQVQAINISTAKREGKAWAMKLPNK